MSGVDACGHPHGLEVAQRDFAAAGVAEDHARAERGGRARSSGRPPRGRGSGRSPSGVPGRGLRKLRGTSVGLELLELDEELDPLGIGLAHVDEGAAAELHPELLDHAAGVGPLVPGVGGDDLGEVGPCRLDVVVVAVDAALRQAAGLVLGEDAGADGDVEARLVVDEGDEVEDALHGALVGSAQGEHDAELGGAELGRLPGGIEDLVSVEEGRRLDRGLEAGGL